MDIVNRCATSKKLSITLLLSLLTTFAVVGQRQEAIEDYISKYESLAVAEMQRTGVPASIKLAQGIHETQAGTSMLVQRSNNHFGIKCKTGWSGPSVRHDDDERSECFRKYETAEASFVDHSNFLKNSPRYFQLFDLSPTDYAGWAQGLKNAGYATNPQYAKTLIRLIEEYDLNRYTLLALGQPLPATNSSAAPVTTVAALAPPSALPEQRTASTVTEVATTSADKVVSERVTPPTSASNDAFSSASQSVAENRTSYPAGVFEKEGCRAVWVKAGTPFLAIADQYRVPLMKLFEYNHMEPLLEADRDQVMLLERKAATGFRLPFRNKRSR